jgi:bacillolysin
MHRLFAAILASLGALALASPALAASDKAAALKRELGPSVKVAGHAETGQVRFVGAAPGDAIPSGAAPGASAREAARSFLSAHGASFGVRDQARDLRVEASKTFRGGRSSVRFQQLLDGVPVLGGELVVNLDADRDVLAASGELLPGSVARLPRVTADAARAEALAAVAKARKVSKARLTGSAPSLAVYDARLLGGPGPARRRPRWSGVST